MLLSVTVLFTLASLAASTAIPATYRGGTGDGTFYSTGLGSCGITNKDSDHIVALSHLFFDTYPGATANPNKNPVCKKKIKATYKGKSVTVMATDRCTGCKMHDLDFSPSAFKELASESEGRIHGVKWEFI